MQWINNTYRSFLIAVFLWNIASTLNGQEKKILLVNVDSVYYHSNIASFQKTYSDSIYEYHFEKFASEADTLFRDMYALFQSYSACCSCYREELEKRKKQLAHRQTEIEIQQKRLSEIKAIVTRDYFKFIKELIVDYCLKINPSPGLIIDSSKGVMSIDDKEITSLTENLVKAFNRQTASDLGLPDLNASISRKIMRLMSNGIDTMSDD